jgi:hypothetical protein
MHDLFWKKLMGNLPVEDIPAIMVQLSAESDSENFESDSENE